MSALRFTGRALELEDIKERWRLAADVESPVPQIVLIKGERGVGKTRLALEFYRWLSESIDQQGSDGYWPDALAIYDNAFDVNPRPRQCNFRVKIPYLWWGLHVSKDTIPRSDGYLAPHLAALLARSVMRRTGLSLAAALGRLGLDVGMGLLEDLTYLSLAKRIFEGGKEGFDIVRGGLNEASIEKALSIPHSRAESVLRNLESVFDPKQDYAHAPGVVFVDDAQDADKDTAFLPFIEKLFHKSVTGNWPLLILITHWKRELSAEVTPQEYSFSGVLRHGLYSDPTENGPAAGLPGGYLNTKNFHEIDLGPLSDLAPALREQLPGLSSEQSTTILDATGGNPRYLEQVILYAWSRKGGFEDHDTSKALTPEGYKRVLEATKSREIFEVVRERLMDTPVEVQEAICLASLQGIRFDSDLVDAVANTQLGRSVRAPLERAEEPYTWVVGTKRGSGQGVGVFVERLFYQVAEDVRPDVKSLGTEATLQVTFRDTIRSLTRNEEFAASGLPESQLIAYEIAADLFENSSEADDRALAQNALSLVAKVHLSRFSLEAATAAYERLLASEPAAHTPTEWINRVQLLDWLAAAYRKLGWRSKLSNALKRVVWLSYQFIQDNGRILVFAGDDRSVRKYFEDWRRKHPDTAPEVYPAGISWLVRGLLGMSELARVWPDISSAEGDDPIPFAPFMVKSLELHDLGELTGYSDLDANEIAEFLRERAINLGKIVGQDFAEREHFKLLVDDVAKVFSDEGQLDGAIDALERALEITKELGEDILQIQVLSNLGVVYGQKSDRELSEKVLLEAGRINNEKYVRESFSVVALANGPRVEHRKADAVSSAEESRILARLDIPIRLAPLFDHDPDEAVRQFRQLVRMVGNIEGNLGRNALEADEYDKAENRYKYALTSFVDLNDGPNIATTLRNLAAVAKRSGDNAKACDYWRQSLSVYQKLRALDAGEIAEIGWKNAIQDVEAAMDASECGRDENVSLH